MIKDQFLLSKNQYTDSVMFLFENMDIYGFISEESEGEIERYKGKNVYDIKKCNCEDFVNIKLMVCMKKMETEIQKYEKLGWIYGKNLLFVRDYIEQEYCNEIVGDRKLIIWGMGKIGSRFINDWKYLKIDYCIDRNPKAIDTNSKDMKIYLPEILQNEKKEELFIIVTTDYYWEIKEELDRLGLKEYINYLSYHKIDLSICELIEQAIFTPPITSWKCQDPFRVYRLLNNGDVYCCHRPIWIKTAVGNAFWQSWDQIKNSLIFKAVKLSIFNRNYVFCHSEECDMLKEPKKALKNDKEYLRTETSIGCADFDESCNLYCESCRDKILVSKDKNKEYLLDYFDQNILSETDILLAAGNGEVFLSNYYKQLLDGLNKKNVKRVKGILLLTNGTLANTAKMDEWGKYVGGNLGIIISIDAAHSDTYSVVRRGGNFKKLYCNLLQVAEKRRKNEIKVFSLVFVVQKKNYREMVDFVKMAESLDVDGINFIKIDNWGTYTEEEYREICMWKDKETPMPELECEFRKLENLDTNIKIFINDCYAHRLFLYERLN